MPELPEVETTVKGINKRVLNRTFIDVWSDWEKVVKKPRLPGGQEKNFAKFKKEIKGKKIIKTWRRAKNIIIDLSGGYALLVHMKMTGHLLYGRWKNQNGKWVPEDKDSPLSDPYNRFLHIIFFLDNGNMLALSDSRKFAKIELWKKEELLASPEFKKLGPEPLEKDFSFGKFKLALQKKRSGKIKQVLMDPYIIAGIGNIYANEALWWAKINPQKNVAKLTEKELKFLYKAVIRVLQAGVDLGGESFSDYRNIDGKEGDFDDERKAYKREGEKCSRCRTAIKRVAFGGRSSFYCPTCQKL